ALRPALTTASGALLTAQARATNGPPWDVFQTTGADGAVTLFVFQSDAAAGSIVVKPTGLAETAMYGVQSVDIGWLGAVSGADLTTDGIEVAPSLQTAAHILTVQADSSAEATRLPSSQAAAPPSVAQPSTTGTRAAVR